ncbi:AraC family transcriptional regulator [Bacillus sp. 31A1R]|uniref:AraC family transcriptional regulator n=2 Tax=Robertmurraya mangrovi TaxID=3098077 RepID=A0ABU5J2D2_9BACI|nr:AraC family transcriptional regulator [Bacillus sp. 31A1R]
MLKKHKITYRDKKVIQTKTDTWSFIIEGSGSIVVNGKKYIVTESDSLLFRTGTDIQIFVDEGQDLDLYLLQPPDEAPKEILKVFDIEKLTLKSNSKIFILLKKLETKFKCNTASDYFKQQSLFYEILSLLYEEYEQYTEMDLTGIKKSVAYMERHFDEGIYVGQLSEIAGMTPSSYSRAFKKMTGQTPSEYLTLLRINHAKDLLNSLSLKEVANTVGFQDEFYFSRVFKKKEGVSPTIYMKQNGERIAVVSQMFLQDHLLSLGIQPVVAPSYPHLLGTKTGFPSYLSNRLKGTKALNVENEINLDDILQVRPDLILKMDLHSDQEVHSIKESSIVHLKHLPSWEEYLMQLATLTKRETEAERTIYSMKRIEKEAKDALLPFTRKGKWAIVWVRENDIRLYGRSGHALNDLFFSNLGFNVADEITHEGYKCNALSELIRINPERILFLWSSPATVKRALKMDSAWKELRAVKENQIYCPASIEWDPWGPIGREHMIRESISFFRKIE